MDEKIHILDTNKKITEEFISALRRREIPTKFAYWGQYETQNWLNVCKDPGYINWGLEIELLKTNLPKIIKLIDPKVANLISLGIGNGEKDKMILNAFLKNRPMRYFAIDISLHMVEAGFKTLCRVPIEKTAYIGDFEHLEALAPKIKKHTNSNNLISILGNTLGNLGQAQIFNLIRQSMDKNDYLLFAVQILEKDEKELIQMGKILAGYNAFISRKLAHGSLEKAGITSKDGVLEVEMGPYKLFPALISIEFYFKLNKNKFVKYAGREFNFKAGERISVNFSHKYSENIINYLLKDNGLQLIKSWFPKDKEYALVLAKRLK